VADGTELQCNTVPSAPATSPLHVGLVRTASVVVCKHNKQTSTVLLFNTVPSTAATSPLHVGQC
jgi:hypothetical protein